MRRLIAVLSALVPLLAIAAQDINTNWHMKGSWDASDATVTRICRTAATKNDCGACTADKSECCFHYDTDQIALCTASTPTWTDIGSQPSGTPYTVAAFDSDGTGLQNSTATDNGTTFAFTKRVAYNSSTTITLAAGNNDNIDIGDAVVVKLDSTAGDAVIRSMSGGTEGRDVILSHTAGNGTITITHQSGTTPGANRFYLPGSIDATIALLSSVEFFYDSTHPVSGKWKMVRANVTGFGNTGRVAVFCGDNLGDPSQRLCNDSQAATFGISGDGTSLKFDANGDGTASMSVDTNVNVDGDVVLNSAGTSKIRNVHQVDSTQTGTNEIRLRTYDSGSAGWESNLRVIGNGTNASIWFTNDADLTLFGTPIHQAGEIQFDADGDGTLATISQTDGSGLLLDGNGDGTADVTVGASDVNVRGSITLDRDGDGTKATIVQYDGDDTSDSTLSAFSATSKLVLNADADGTNSVVIYQGNIFPAIDRSARLGSSTRAWNDITSVDLYLDADGDGTYKVVKPGDRTLLWTATQSGNYGKGVTDMWTDTLAHDTLSRDGDDWHIRAGGTLNTASADKKVQVVLGSTTIFDSGSYLAGVAATASWDLDVICVREQATSQKCVGTIHTSDASAPSYSYYLTSSEDLTTDLTIKLVGDGTTGPDDVVLEFVKVKYGPAP